MVEMAKKINLKLKTSVPKPPPKDDKKVIV